MEPKPRNCNENCPGNITTGPASDFESWWKDANHTEDPTLKKRYAECFAAGRQKLQAKHDANCLLRLLLETLPIQLEKHSLTHDRTACAMLIQDSIDYLFRDGEDTLVESPSNDEQQMLKMAYTMGQTTEQKLSEHLRKGLEEANKSLDEYRECVDKWRIWYDNASEDAKKWRRDAQYFYGALVKIAEYHGTKDEVWANNMRTMAKEALADRP